MASSKKTKDRWTSYLDSVNQHHIYMEWFLNDRAGGPPGYLANLLQGLNEIESPEQFSILFNTFSGKRPVPKKTQPADRKSLKEHVKDVFYTTENGRNFYAQYLSKYQRSNYENLYHFLENPAKMMPDGELISEIDLSRTKTIHVHSVIDVVKVKNYLNNHFYSNIKVILTCHTPESYASEQYQNYLEDGQNTERAEKLREMWSKVEMLGYSLADIMIFPSPEAIEPFDASIEGFSNMISEKDIRYMATGTKGIHLSLNKEEAKKKYGVEGKFVIGYIGRHNQVKGYDLLVNSAKEVLSKRDDIAFLIGGKPSNELHPLDNPSWIEAGFVKPSEMLSAVDYFVLPNRETYYDLVLLEVISAGIPVIATATGGNKSVKKVVKDLLLCEPSSESIADSILHVADLTESERNVISNREIELYRQYFTEKEMAKRYVDTISDIYSDYRLGEVK